MDTLTAIIICWTGFMSYNVHQIPKLISKPFPQALHRGELAIYTCKMGKVLLHCSPGPVLPCAWWRIENCSKLPHGKIMLFRRWAQNISVLEAFLKFSLIGCCLLVFSVCLFGIRQPPRCPSKHPWQTPDTLPRHQQQWPIKMYPKPWLTDSLTPVAVPGYASKYFFYTCPGLLKTQKSHKV